MSVFQLALYLSDSGQDEICEIARDEVLLSELQMPVRIRLKRIGRRHKPSYRVTAIDGRRDRSGTIIEELGSFDPLKADDQQMSMDRERIEYWLSVGAQPTDTMRRLLQRQGIELKVKAKKEPRPKRAPAAKAAPAKATAAKAGKK